MSFKLRLVQLRQALGLKQQEFADNITISQPFLSQVETGRNPPSGVMLLNLASKYCHVNMNWLLTGQGSMFTGPDQVRAPEPRTGLDAELEELRVLGRAAPQALAWRVLNLLETFPEGLSTKELQARLDVSLEALEATLITLKRERRIGLEGTRYHKLQSVPVRGSGAGDAGAAVDVSLTTLLQSILPHLERGQAGLLLAELSVENLDDWLKAVRSSMVQLIDQQDRPSGERVRVLLASSRVDPPEE